jgi:uncharacterized phage-associated protein
MATARDVAQYIVERLGTTSAIKLEKLVYYCQAWCLVWTGKPLFLDTIEAWANGPVIPNLYAAHQGKLNVSQDDEAGDSSKLTIEDKEIMRVLTNI